MARKRIKAGARQRDVAAVAGVSTATVSAVVNGRAAQYGICRATQEKVQVAIRQMGYTPSLSALDMVAGRNSLVGLAITADYPGSDRLIAAMEPALAQSGFRLIVICLPADPAAAVARITDLARYGIGGLAIFPARALPLPGIGCPVVMVGKAGVGLPADCSPSAVNQLGQATVRWLQMASQGLPPGELLLEPVPVVTPTNPPPAPSPPPRPPPSVPPVPVPKPSALSPVEVPAVSVPALSPVEVPPSVPEAPEALAAPDVIPAAPVAEPTVTIQEPFPVPVTAQPEAPPLATDMPPEAAVSHGNSATEQPDNSPKLPSESIQMPETVVIDPVGQATADPQVTAPDGSESEPVPAPAVEPVASTSASAVSLPPPEPMPEPPPEPMPVYEPVPAPEVVTPPESEVSPPAPEIVTPEPLPEPIPVVTEAEPVPGGMPAAPPSPLLPVEEAMAPEPPPQASEPTPDSVASDMAQGNEPQSSV